MSNLNERLISTLKASGLVDYDQRSALGLARTWVEKGLLPATSPHESYQKRDALANQIIGVLQEFPDKDFREALVEARATIDEPFQIGEFERKAKPKKDKPKSAE